MVTLLWLVVKAVLVLGSNVNDPELEDVYVISSEVESL